MRCLKFFFCKWAKVYLRKGISWLSPPFPSSRQPLTTYNIQFLLMNACLPWLSIAAWQITIHQAYNQTHSLSLSSLVWACSSGFFVSASKGKVKIKAVTGWPFIWSLWEESTSKFIQVSAGYGSVCLWVRSTFSCWKLLALCSGSWDSDNALQGTLAPHLRHHAPKPRDVLVTVLLLWLLNIHNT